MAGVKVIGVTDMCLNLISESALKAVPPLSCHLRGPAWLGPGKKADSYKDSRTGQDRDH